VGEPRDREHLRQTFNAAADLYQRARPDYPEEIFVRVLDMTGIQPGRSHLLEIGCATGKATVPFARRGFRITCVELGTALAAAAVANLAEFSDVDVHVAAFETWHPPGATRYDLVYAATAWGWVDPAVRCNKAADLLVDGGHLAIWGAGHVFPKGGDPFFAEIQQVYDEIGEGLPPGARFLEPDEMPDNSQELEASGRFDVLHVERFDWERRYDADTYIDLLNTFSGHIDMEQWQRDQLYGEIRRRLAERNDGVLRRHWGGALTMARRRE
jgi:SAM-dependent methyltransferase